MKNDEKLVIKIKICSSFLLIKVLQYEMLTFSHYLMVKIGLYRNTKESERKNK
jgi:hypothetical protein